MTGIIDYGMGNLASIQNALDRLQEPWTVSSDPAVLETCDRLILPGVGAIADCMKNLQDAGLDQWLKTVKLPLLGICLGMQALFSYSEENGGVPCLGLVEGTVTAMTDPAVRIPHIGWNRLEQADGSAPYVYYDHSYYACGVPREYIRGISRHGSHIITGIIEKDNLVGCQFHPEKSGQAGLAILDWFIKEKQI